MIVQRYIWLLFCGLSFHAFGQDNPPQEQRMVIDGKVVTAIVTDGDTLIVAELEEATVTSFQNFSSDTQYRKYLKYRRYASVVYPYAVESIRLFRKVEEETAGMKKRKRKKYVRGIQKDLKKEFTEPLKGLSRTQGKILIKMIENELDTPMFDLLKGVKSGFAASKWQTVGKFYGYDLKEGYIPGQDPILDAVLQDYDISHEEE